MEIDLDQMKLVWADYSKKLDMQKKLTDQLIVEMAAHKSASRFNQMLVVEVVGLLFAGLMCIYILLHFDKLESLPNQLSAGGTIGILIISMAFGFKIIHAIRRIDILNDSYGSTLTKFKDFKRLMKLYKRTTIVFYVFMPIIILPVAVKLMGGKDLFDDLAKYGYTYLMSLLVLPLVWILIYWFYRNNIQKISRSINKIKNDE